jgi:hypothetical protein
MRELVQVIKSLYPRARLELQACQEERAVASGIDSTLAKDDLDYETQFTLEQAIRDHLRNIGGGHPKV